MVTRRSGSNWDAHPEVQKVSRAHPEVQERSEAFPVARKRLGGPPGGLEVPPGGLGVVGRPTWRYGRLNRMSERGREALPVGLKGMGVPCRGPGEGRRPTRRFRRSREFHTEI